MKRVPLAALLTALLTGVAGGQQAPTPLPVQPAPGQATPLTAQDVSDQLPGLIRTARQVILYAPDLGRPDVAEALRLAITQRGTSAYLITSGPPLYRDDSLTLRLALMRIPTYLAGGSGVPFILIDGQAVLGAGVTGPGRAAWASRSQSLALAEWVRGVTTAKPLNVVSVVREWVRRHGGPTLK